MESMTLIDNLYLKVVIIMNYSIYYNGMHQLEGKNRFDVHW